ncbi:MAG: 3-methyl-2-oxobutanoate hydroxymethyltransferase [Parvibaculales bacterium]
MNTPLVVLTAYDEEQARAFAPYVDMLLVGDSVAMVVHGAENTLGADMEMMRSHAAQVVAGAGGSFIVVDMPYGSYEHELELALENARSFIKLGAEAVKVEGGEERADCVSYLASHNIKVMGHIGLLPQNIEKLGGYKIQGKTEESRAKLLRDAKALEKAGAFAIVLECIIEPVAAEIAQSISIPSIGIGASPKCSGQVLVAHDILGLTKNPPSFAKSFADKTNNPSQAAKAFALAVREGKFPQKSHVYPDENNEN